MARRDDENVQLASRGVNAAQVLDNPAYIEAMAALMDDVVTEWKQCPIRDAEGQRLLLQLARTAEKFDRMLRDYVTAGEFAQSRIDVDDMRDEGAARRMLRKVL